MKQGRRLALIKALRTMLAIMFNFIHHDFGRIRERQTYNKAKKPKKIKITAW